MLFHFFGERLVVGTIGLSVIVFIVVVDIGIFIVDEIVVEFVVADAVVVLEVVGYRFCSRRCSFRRRGRR